MRFFKVQRHAQRPAWVAWKVQRLAWMVFVFIAFMSVEAIAQTPDSDTVSAKAVQVVAAEDEPAPQTERPSLRPFAVSVKEITVTATRNPRETFNTPNPVNVIGRERIEREQAQTITDLLQYEPGIEVFGGFGSRIRQTPVIRGLRGNRVLLRVDGKRLNFNTAHRGNINFVDVNAVERIEVVRGPASALEGSNALGGVINVTTRDPEDMLEPGKTFGASLRTSFNSVNSEFAEYLSVYGKAGERFEYLVNGTRRDAGDTSTPDGDLAGTAFSSNDLLAKGIYHLTDKDKVEFMVQAFDDTSEFPFLEDPRFASREREDDTFRQLYDFAYERSDPGALFSTLYVNLYAHLTDIKEEIRQEAFGRGTPGIVGSVSDQVNDINFNTYGVELRASMPFGTANNHHVLTYGFEYFRDGASELSSFDTDALDASQNVISTSFRQTTQLPNATADNFGFYIQDEIDLFERLVLIPGVRYDVWDMRAESTVGFLGDLEKRSQSADRVNPKLGILGKITDNFNLVGNVATGFRTPSFRELFIAGPHFPGSEFIPNPNLKPETSVNYDAGFKWQSERVRFDATYFYNDLNNFIDFRARPVEDVLFFQPLNVQEALIQGVEVAGSFAPSPQWLMYANYTYTKGDDTTNNEPLAEIFPQRLVPGVQYFGTCDKAWCQRFFLDLRARIVDTQDRVPDGTDRTPGYVTYDLRGGISITDRMDLNLAVENFTNKKFRQHQSVLTAEGINGVVSLAYNF